MDIFIARQPILDANERTVAYELLYRAGQQEVFPGIEGSEATSSVLQHVFCSLDIQKVTGKKKAFINFTRRLLLSGVPEIDASQIVIEILEDVIIDDLLVEQCKRLTKRGFVIALDDFEFNESFLPLLPYASIVKIDWKASHLDSIKRLVAHLKRYDVTFLAEKIETREEFLEAKGLGFEYFQGFFFARPEIICARDVSSSQWALLRILKALQKNDLDIDELARIISLDAILSLKLLKIVNVAASGLRREVSSIHQAIVLLGEEEVRRWFFILLLAQIGSNKPRELLVNAAIRARFGQNLAISSGRAEIADQVFLMGLLSLLNVILGRPLAEILKHLPLALPIRDALLKGKGPLRIYLYMLLAYERGYDLKVKRAAIRLGLDMDIITNCYIEAVVWSESLTNNP